MVIRWQASVYYRGEPQDGADVSIEVVHDLEELADIHNLVEAGPHWDTIERIEIVRVNHVTSETLTIEQAERL